MTDGLKRARAAARHPAEVTASRLLTHYERWFDKLSGEERDAISKIRHALYRIADEDEQEAGQWPPSPSANSEFGTEEAEGRP